MSPESDLLSGFAEELEYMLGQEVTEPLPYQMDHGLTQDVNNLTSETSNTEVQSYNQDAERFLRRTDQLREKVEEIEKFYSNLIQKQLNTSKVSLSAKDRDKGRRAPSLKSPQQDAEPREQNAAKRKQYLMTEIRLILQQITARDWAGPFLNPADVEGWGLHDYYKVIEKPMDFRTIKNRMKAKDGSGYKNVRQICADVRLIFKNAIKYNGVEHPISVWASTLLEKFEEKWLRLLPKVIEEENRLREEEAQAQLKLELAPEAAYAQMAKDISNELFEDEYQLDKLRKKVIQNCRKMTPGEKLKLGTALCKLSGEDLGKALEIVAQNDPTLQVLNEEVELDMDALNKGTLWSLNFLLKDVLEVKGKSPASIGDRNPTSLSATVVTHDATTSAKNNKRRRDICEAIAKTAKKKCQEASP